MTAQYQEFVDGIQRRAKLSTAQEAGRSAVHVVEVLAARLDGIDREQLRTGMPGAIRDTVRWDRNSVVSRDQATLIGEVAELDGRSPEQARIVTQAVLSRIADDNPSLAYTLQHRLPDDHQELFVAPGHGPPPELAAAGADDRPRPLDDDELTRALAQLVGWAGDSGRISRTISLPQDRWTPLLNQVEAAQQELSHHAKIEKRQDQDELVFSLCTRSLDAVTELDLQLARRIDEAISRVGSGG